MTTERKSYWVAIVKRGPDLMIMRTPWPEPRWREVLKAMTPVMHAHGLKAKELWQLEFLATDDPKFSQDNEYYRRENEKLLPKLREAFEGDPDRFEKFWLYDWQDGRFVLVRKPKSEANPASDYSTEVLHLDTSGRGSYEQHTYEIRATDEHGTLVGYMKVRLFRNVADVSYVEVAESARRRGVAEAMYRRLYEWADEENVYVKHAGMTPEGFATVTALRERGVIPKRRKVANPKPTDEETDAWLVELDAWEATRDRMRGEFVGQAKARFSKDRIVSVESYGDEVRFTSSLTKSARPGVAYQVTDFEGDLPIGHREYDDLEEALVGLWDVSSPRTKSLPPMPNPANPRGRAGTQMSGLPVEHARAPEGGPLCGAKERRWGSLYAQYQDEVSCRRCKKKLEEGAESATRKRPNPGPDEPRASKYRYLGTDDEESVCSCCGRQGLKKVAWLESLDEEGNEISVPLPYGTTCAAHLMLGRHPKEKKPTKTDSEKVLMEAWLRSVQEAWDRAKVLTPPEPTFGKTIFGTAMIRLGDVGQPRTIRSYRGEGEEPIYQPIEYDLKQLTWDWRKRRATEIGKEMGIVGIHPTSFGGVKNPSGRLRRASARISNP